MTVTTIIAANADQLISALCNTLIYSLLQGVLLAVIAGLIVIFTRRASASQRYNLLVGLLVLFVISAGVTFLMQLGKIRPVQAIHQTGLIFVDNTTPTINAANNHIQPAGAVNLGNIMSYLNHYQNTIVLIWFLIICVKSIQLATGLQGIYRYKRTQVSAVDPEWLQQLQQMTDRLGIRQKITLLASGLAKVPMVVGHLRPVILIPMGLLTALAPAEIESILMHELAHICRRDYLVNLLQGLVEIIFFFNPAVLWVSQLIRTEREHCCDDIALAQNCSKAGYIRALLSCEEYQQAAPGYAMAFPGQKNHLLGRVQRLVTNRNNSLGAFEKTLLTVCLVALGICFSAFAEKERIKQAAHAVIAVIKHSPANKADQAKLENQQALLNNQQELLQRNTEKLEWQAAKADVEAQQQALPAIAANDTIPQPNYRIYKPESVSEGTGIQTKNGDVQSYIYKKDGTLYQVNFAEPEVWSVQINGRTLSKDEMTARKPEIDEVISKMDQDAAALKGHAFHPRFSLSGKLSGNLNRSLGNLGPVNTNVQVANVSPQAKPAIQAKPANPAKDIQAILADKAKVSPKSPYSSTYEAYKADTTQYGKGRQDYQASKEKYIADRGRIIDEMMRDGLISTRDNLSFKLSNSEFIINYKKQPNEVYQRYLTKYAKTTGYGDWTWMYNYDTSKRQETSTVVDNIKN